MKIIVEQKSPEERAGKELSEMLRIHKEKDILLMLSGGSALTVLPHIDTSLLSEKYTLSVVDERFSMDPEINNFSQLEKTDFFDVCIEKQCAIIGTRVHKKETLPSAVMNFETQLLRWRDAYPEGVVIALLGMGADGHTAGVMPFPESKRLFEDLFLDEEWVASFDAEGKSEHTLRFTVTLTFLKEQVHGAVVYAQGENKRKALEYLKDASLSAHEVPAKVFSEMADVTLVTNQEIDT